MDIVAHQRSVAEATTDNFEAYQHYFQGQNLVAQMKFEEALPEHKKAVELDPSFALAYDQYWQHQSADAAETLRRASRFAKRLAPKDALLFQGLEAAVSGKPDEALAKFGQVLAKFPDEKSALFMSGDVLVHRDHATPAELTQAKDFFDRALKIDPTDVAAQNHAVLARQRLHDWKGAGDLLRAQLSKRPEPETYQQLIMVDVTDGDANAAMADARAFGAAFPDSTWARGAVVSTARLVGREAEAEASLAELQASPKPELQRIALGHRASIALEKGQRHRALALFEQYLASAKASKDTRAEATGALSLASAWGDRDPVRTDAFLKEFEELKVADLADPAGMVVPRFLWREDFARARRVRAVLKGGFTQGLDVEIAAFEGSHAHRLDTPELKMLNGAFEEVSGVNLAFLHLVVGRCLLMGGDAAGAHAHSEQAISTLRQIGSKILWSVVLAEAAEAAQKAGDDASAATHEAELIEWWKDADPDLPELREARQSLSRLKATAKR